MTTAAAALTAAQSKTVAVAQRSLPGILLTLIAVAGLSWRSASAFASADVERPVLTYAWAFVAALSVAVVLMLDAPFSGSITVSPEPCRWRSGPSAADATRRDATRRSYSTCGCGKPHVAGCWAKDL